LILSLICLGCKIKSYNLMPAERKSFIENPFVKGELVFIGVLVAAGISIAVINQAFAMAR